MDRRRAAAARGRPGLSAQPLGVERPCRRSHGPRDRRPSRVRIRELGGLRRGTHAEANLRYKALQEETELLRGLPPLRRHGRSGPSAKGDLRYANAAYVRALEGASVADTIHRNLELLKRPAHKMNRGLNDNQLQRAVADRGRRRRRIYDDAGAEAQQRQCRLPSTPVKHPRYALR